MEGLSLDKFLEHQVNTNGWALEKGGQVNCEPYLHSWVDLGVASSEFSNL